jgi:DNA-binding MarR family transcriptional regulator
VVRELARGKPTPGDKVELVKALKLLNPEMSQRDIAREAKMSKTTVQNILANLEDDEEFQKFREEKKREQIAKALDIASTYIDHLKNPEVIAKASARDSAIVAGTMIDKAQLLAGEPTTITERKEPTPDLVKELDQKVRKLKELTGS